MAKCYTCGKVFHACSSCGLDHMWEYDYCSSDCYRMSLEFKEATIVIKAKAKELGMTIKELYDSCDIDYPEYDIDVDVLRELSYD